MRLPADPSNVGVARQVVAESAKALGMDDARLADLKLAISEACTNAVTHAYGDGAGHHFRLSVEVDDRLLHVHVTDDGYGIDHPRLNGGLGLGLTIAERVSQQFETSPGDTLDPEMPGTTVSMTFPL